MFRRPWSITEVIQLYLAGYIKIHTMSLYELIAKLVSLDDLYRSPKLLRPHPRIHSPKFRFFSHLPAIKGRPTPSIYFTLPPNSILLRDNYGCTYFYKTLTYSISYISRWLFLLSTLDSSVTLLVSNNLTVSLPLVTFSSPKLPWSDNFIQQAT